MCREISDTSIQFEHEYTEEQKAFEAECYAEVMEDEMRSFWRWMQRSSWPTDDPGGRCANCGIEAKFAKGCIVGSACYDGEWCCSYECDRQLAEEGCPLE